MKPRTPYIDDNRHRYKGRNYLGVLAGIEYQYGLGDLSGLNRIPELDALFDKMLFLSAASRESIRHG